MRAVRFDTFGGPGVLRVDDVAEPSTPPDRIRVRVQAAGLNRYDAKRRSGAEGDVRFPAGNGNEFAGVVDEVGAEVDGLRVGDQVLGRAYFRSQADLVVVPPGSVVPLPEGLPIEVAGALDAAARTATDLVRFARIGAGDVVLVGAAAGGVGIVAAQLARRAGATVLGTASAPNADLLDSLQIVPVRYGDGLEGRLRAAAPDGLTAVLDAAGRGTIEAGLALGAAADRIVTIADREAAERFGTAHLAQGPARNADLAEVAALVAAGEVVLPIERTYPVEDVVAAYEHLETGHLTGKLVLTF
ncbi:MAG TPA: NADP-dependent oxidoreductase [Naasia sp.]|jgi:NADPH:quinone reductase-like Zn-dependent oxidoreductase